MNPSSPDSAGRARSLLRFYLPLLLWITASAVLSSHLIRSNTAGRLVTVAAQIVFPPESLQKGAITVATLVIWKFAHVAVYFVLALLVWRALRQDAAERWRWRWAGQTLLAGVVVAGLDELHQHFERYRHARLSDVGLDVVGVLLAISLLYYRTRQRESDPLASR